MMKTALCFVAAAILAAHAGVAQNTQKLTASKSGDNGIIYTLPRTVLDITIETEYTERAPGEFHNYARRHLGITDAVTAPSRSVDVKSVTIVPRGIADDANRWLVQFKSGSAAYMTLNASGVPLALNTETVPEPEAVSLPVARDAAPTPLETEAARQAVTQDMTRSSSVSKRAEMAAQRIFELREMRSDLMSGQADNTPPDGKAMQLVLDNISAQEAALTAMFAGTTKTYTRVNTISYDPDSASLSGYVLARVSPVDGVVDVSDLSGAPVTLDIQILESASLPVNEKGEVKKFPKGGFAYRIPGNALVRVSYDGRIVAEREIPLAQLGVTFGLEPNLFTDKKAPSMLLLDETTGAIKLLGPVQ